MEFSKRYFKYLVLLELCVIIYIAIMVFITCDLTPLYWVITALSAEISVYSAFYLWKAKNENRAKYAQQYLSDIANTYGIDMAIRMIDIIIKD